mgnify:CR=1 FL=1
MGAEETPTQITAPPGARHTGRRASRILAGCAAAGITTPFVAWAAGTTNALVPLALLGLLTGVLGAHFAQALTRRDLRRWVELVGQRIDARFRGEAAATDVPGTDVDEALDGMVSSLDSMLDSRLRHERDAIISTITSLASALEARDPYTRNHSAQVGKLAARVGREMGLSRAELYELHLAGLLHDLGKIGIPDSILLKPAGLTSAEYETMKTHSMLGARILSGIPGLEPVARIVLHHHEMVDGRGYPDGLVGEEIPLGARIIAACDTYLSMVEHRPYRDPQAMTRVVRELRRVAGKQLDADVVDALLSLLARESDAVTHLLDEEGRQAA